MSGKLDKSLEDVINEGNKSQATRKRGRGGGRGGRRRGSFRGRGRGGDFFGPRRFGGGYGGFGTQRFGFVPRFQPYRLSNSRSRGRGRGRGRGRRGRGRGRRNTKPTVSVEDLDAELDNYNAYKGNPDEMEAAKAAGQPVLNGQPEDENE